jgi:hypothetical protein
MDIEIKKTIEYYQNNPQTKELIEDIRIVIDELGNNFTKLNEIIKELARRIYEDGICEKGNISQVIKYILIDKIKERKISKRLIEQSLPKDFKRKYVAKSEKNALSSSKKPEIITITNAYEETSEDNSSSTFTPNNNPINSTGNKIFLEENNKIEKIRELEEVISKSQQMVVADQLLTENMQFIIPKEHFQTLKNEIEKSQRECYVYFNKNKKLREVHSDN